MLATGYNVVAIPLAAGVAVPWGIVLSLDDERSFVVVLHLTVPFDPQGLVALNFLSIED